MAALMRSLKVLGVGSGIAAAALFTNINPSNQPEPDSKLVLTSETVNLETDNLSPFRPSPKETNSFNDAARALPLSSFHSKFSDTRSQKLEACIAKAQDICERLKHENGLPGLVISVSVNGKLVWEQGIGYSDLENCVPMSTDAVFRIASISKPITSCILAKLMEEGKIDLDLPIQTYVSDYPEKQVDGKKVVITTRHLLSHLSGIRHYLKKGEKEEDEFRCKEYFLKQRFNSVDESLALFKNDELLHEPGTKYLYTTHGFTVVSKIIESITGGVPFTIHAKRLFNLWGLKHTYLDIHEPIIYHRARCYSKDKKGRLVNSPYVDNSYKWGGGGFLSDVNDITKFAHMLIYSWQYSFQQNNKCYKTQGNRNRTPFLKHETVKKMWTGDERTAKSDSDFLYGLGFSVEQPFSKCMFCKESEFLTVGHSGGAVGASSILFLRLPGNTSLEKETADDVDIKKGESLQNYEQEQSVRGLVIVVITNLTGIGLSKTAYDISDLFTWLI